MIGVAVGPPMTSQCAVEGRGTLAPTKACPDPGYSSLVFHHLMQMAKLDYGLVPLGGSYTWGGKSGDGPCDYAPDSVLGMIRNGSFDTLAAEFVFTEERSACFDFSVPTLYDDHLLIYKNVEDPAKNLFAFVQVYTAGIWATVLGTVLLVTLGMTLTMRLFAAEASERARPLSSSASEAFWTVVQFVTDQASTIPATFALSTSSARHLLSLLGLFAMFFLKLYESGLLTSLLLPSDVRPFASLSGLASLVQQGRAEFLLEGGTWTHEWLADERITAMDSMRAAVELHPVLVAPSTDAALQMVRSAPAGSIGLVTGSFLAGGILAEDCQLASHRDDQLPKIRNAFVWRKGHPLRPLLDANINAAVAHTHFVWRRHHKAKRPCAPPSALIGVTNLAGVLVLCGGFVVAAAVAFAFERCRCCQRIRDSEDAYAQQGGGELAEGGEQWAERRDEEEVRSPCCAAALHCRACKARVNKLH